MTTQAELWARFLKLRTDNAPALTELKINRIVAELKSDYPHEKIDLTLDGNIVGTRRLFLDASYADIYLGEPGMKIHVGTMTKGRMGTAHNGRSIEKLQ